MSAADDVVFMSGVSVCASRSNYATCGNFGNIFGNSEVAFGNVFQREREIMYQAEPNALK